jgi:flavin reductase (DIM6/NTAB) family NADH-FMN oxidoreductase RutF
MTANPPFDTRKLRDVLGTFVTGVTIVTTRDPSGIGHGVTANSFSSVSLDPALVLWSQSMTSRSHNAFKESDHFAVHILAEDQIEISNYFAKSRDNKFDGIDHGLGIADLPIIGGCAAYLECSKVAEYPGGDHIVFLGKVERFYGFPKRPLAFYCGKYAVASLHDSVQISPGCPAQQENCSIERPDNPLSASSHNGHGTSHDGEKRLLAAQLKTD